MIRGALFTAAMLALAGFGWWLGGIVAGVWEGRLIVLDLPIRLGVVVLLLNLAGEVLDRRLQGNEGGGSHHG
jgi:hypothetical protein